MRRAASLLFGLVVLAPVAMGGESQTATAGRSFENVSYADYSALSTSARREIFVKLTPERKAEFVRAEMTKWRKTHASELNDEQGAALDEMQALVNPELYAGKLSEEKQAELMEVADRVKEVLSERQFREVVLLSPVNDPE